MTQKEFLSALSISEAKAKLMAHLSLETRVEEVGLDEILGRVAGRDIVAQVDVPPFDRAAMDGYALNARDTFYADEVKPANLKALGYIRAGEKPKIEVKKGSCVGIATGAPLPKGANAVVMVEYTHKEKGGVLIYRSVSPGENVMSAGADIMRGETVVREGAPITSREAGVIASLGMEKVPVYTRPRVAVLSTGDEIAEPGSELGYGRIYDVNSRAICDAVRENGGEGSFLGIVKDEEEALLKKLKGALKGDYDIIITSGGTSAGAGDLAYRIFDKLGKPGMLVHGVAIKPGKPIVIGVAKGKPIFGLPGYPTSAMITFDVFVAPLIRQLAGLGSDSRERIPAVAAMDMYSAKGRHEYLLVNLVDSPDRGRSAYPVLSGSGAITTLAEADGYVEVPEKREMVEAGGNVEVSLLSSGIRPADLTFIGSHCPGLELLLGLLRKGKELRTKLINVGSAGGLAAAGRGEADIAGTHLLDRESLEYNLPFLKNLGLTDKVALVRGYEREQGLLVAKGNPKGITSVGDMLKEGISIINRNEGSGTRVLLDSELSTVAEKRGMDFEDMVGRIEGYEVTSKTHSAVASAVRWGRADVGLAIRGVVDGRHLDFIPLRKESYDLAIPKEKLDKASVVQFLELLRSKEFKEKLESLPGLSACPETGEVIHSPD